LGLAICQSIVHAHGGRIWAGRNDPEGSRFKFNIPLAAPSAIVLCQEEGSSDIVGAPERRGFSRHFSHAEANCGHSACNDTPLIRLRQLLPASGAEDLDGGSVCNRDPSPPLAGEKVAEGLMRGTACEKCGFSVVTTTTSDDVIARAANVQPDAIVLDVADGSITNRMEEGQHAA
ncbi:MAG TPA: hypothetical protein VJB15_04065, partial [Rhodothermia bacterium]|nr:hypothetical protein [Rhodothermia bacterium]